jgi:hypothetical protein
MPLVGLFGSTATANRWREPENALIGCVLLSRVELAVVYDPWN